MKDMDYRLDLYNAVSNYLENANEDDNILIIAHNNKEGDCMFAEYGDSTHIPTLLTEGRKELHNIRESILYAAIYIISTDKMERERFINAIEKIKQPSFQKKIAKINSIRN